MANVRVNPRHAEARRGPYGKGWIVTNQLGGLYAYADSKRDAERKAKAINAGQPVDRLRR